MPVVDPVSLEEETGEAVLDGLHTRISAGFAVLVPAGTPDSIINTATHFLSRQYTCIPIIGINS